MAAYLSRYSDARWGVLAYPVDPDKTEIPPVEARNPWRLRGGQRIWFVTLPYEIGGAATKLQPLLLTGAARSLS
jgi:hypothetical protein